MYTCPCLENEKQHQNCEKTEHFLSQSQCENQNFSSRTTSVVLVASRGRLSSLLRLGRGHWNLLWSQVALLILVSQRQVVMEWSGQSTGHRQRSLSKSKTTAGGGGNQVLLYSSRQFSAHPKSSLTHIDKRATRAAKNTRYCYNQIGPLDQNGWQLFPWPAQIQFPQQ